MRLEESELCSSGHFFLSYLSFQLCPHHGALPKSPGCTNVEYPELEEPHMDHPVRFLNLLLYVSWLSEKCKQGNRA